MRPKSELYTTKRYDEHPRLLHMRVYVAFHPRGGGGGGEINRRCFVPLLSEERRHTVVGHIS